MRLSPDFRPGRTPAVARAAALLSMALLASSLGCGLDRPTSARTVREVTIVLEGDTLRPGQQRLARAVATGLGGEIVDAPVTWRSLTPSTLAVSATGEVLALAPGTGVLRATVGGVVRDRSLQLVNPPAVSLTLQPDSLLLRVPGTGGLATVVPLDAFGDPIIGATPQWATEAARIATVSPAGLVTPVAVGRTVVQVTLDGITRALPVIVEAGGGAAAPLIDSIRPATISPGTPFTVFGARLAVGSASSAVLVDGFAAQVLTSAAGQVTALVPTSTNACVPSGEAAVQVSTSEGVGAQRVRIALAPRRAPAVGEAALLLTAAEAGCVELPASGRYVVSVLHAGRALGAGAMAATLDLRSGSEAAATLQRVEVAAGQTMPDAYAMHTASTAAHPELLARSIAFASTATAARSPARSLARSASLQVPSVGGIAALRVPDLDDARLCTAFKPIGARTVYDGTRVAILEDTTTLLGGRPALTGQMDAAIAELGAEIEASLWPLLERFGNPLVMDARLDANGKVVLVLTPALNAMRGGAVMGAVVSCDFFPRAAAPSSNVGEMLYLQVPDVQAFPESGEALRRWRAAVRGTVVHELKHVVGFAERIARGQPLEESWLEEATARHAEELFTRSLTGLTATADADYPAIRCEALAFGGDASCANTPALMRPTLAGLYQFLAAPAARSPLGSAAVGDESFYGSAWSLLRWAMDHGTLDEAGFTRALAVSGQSGVANLEARAGRGWDEMLARWSLALLTDGRSGFDVRDATLRLRGWRLGALFAGFCGDIGGCGGAGSASDVFGRAHPAVLTPLTGDAAVSMPEILPGGFAAFELAPSVSGTTRLLRLRGANGGPLPQTARLALLRVE